MRSSIRAVVLLSVIGGVLPVTSCAEEKQVEVLALTKEQWHEDVAYFARELPARHKNLYHRISQEEFERDVAALDAAIPSLENHEIVIGMQKITAKIGDGHTGVRMPQAFAIYPIAAFWFGDELRVTRAAPAYKDAVGARIVKIGDVDIGEVQKRLLTVICQGENEWYVMSASPSFMLRPEVLHALEIVPELNRASFTFASEDGKQFALDIVPVAADPAMNARMVTLGQEEPLFRKKPGEAFWFTYLPETDTVYANFRKYDSLVEDARKLFELVDSNPTKRLVIDLRQNGGGDFWKGRLNLLSGIKKRPELNQKGNLFVLIGRRTFSAAMVNAIDFKKDTNAILVGEPIGERPNSYSENDEMTLPNSGIVVSYSTRYYKFLDEDAPAVMPDQRIDPAWEDFKAGRDPVLDWALSYTPEN
ncbi:MAG: hypothetical protein SGI88_20125 [Candidatus Hydrogenedentes bacterium]|nr:hypothetical protein [Candidatus Hydrogenedentota bacterium]